MFGASICQKQKGLLRLADLTEFLGLGGASSVSKFFLFFLCFFSVFSFLFF